MDDTDQGPSCILFLNLHGEIASRASYLENNREKGGMNKFFTPRFPSSSQAQQGEGQIGIHSSLAKAGDENVKGLAKDIMSALMDDLIADPSIEHLVNGIPAPPPPYFVQLTGSETPRLTGAPIIQEAAGGEKEENEIEMARKQTLQDNEAQLLISKIMENTIFNLVQDASQGDLDLSKVEKRFVRLENETQPESDD